MFKLRNLEWRLRGMRSEWKHQNNPRTRIISFDLISVDEWRTRPRELRLARYPWCSSRILTWAIWHFMIRLSSCFALRTFLQLQKYVHVLCYMWPKIQWSGPRCWRLSSSGIDCDWILLERALNYDEKPRSRAPPRERLPKRCSTKCWTDCCNCTYMLWFCRLSKMNTSIVAM